LGYAIAGSIIGSSAAGLGYLVGGDIGSAVEGWAGWGAQSGLVGSILGGAAGGAAGAATAYTANYLGFAALQQRFNSQEYWRGLGISTGTGLLGGIAGGAIRYGVDKVGVVDRISNWGYKHDPDWGEKLVDFNAKEFGIKGGFEFQPDLHICANGIEIGGATIVQRQLFLRGSDNYS